MPHRRRSWTRNLQPWPISVAAAALLSCAMAGCGAPKAYSWKPQAATQRARHQSTTTRPAAAQSDMAGADLLEESHRAANVTWIAIPSPDGKKMRWVHLD